MNGTKETNKDELYFCSLDFGISERVALADIDLLPPAHENRECRVNLINVSTKQTAANVSKTTIEPEESQRSVNAFENEIGSIMAIDVINETCEIDINPQLEKGIKQQIEQLITDEYLCPNLAPTPYNYEMTIRLEKDTPFHYTPRKLSYDEREALREIIDDYLKRDIIRQSESPYASPIVMVKKKNGKYRKCINYRSLNKVTLRDNYPMPFIEECLEYLGNKRFFTTLDLENGYHHVRIAEESKKYTSFVTPYGQYEYNRMPFGLKNGPAVFQRYIHDCLRDLIDAGKVIVYMDDITIATDDLESHMEILTEVMRRLAKYELKLNLKKCQFAYETVNFLGYAASKEGIRPNESHIQAIKEYPMPTTLRQVRSCLGLFSYFRKFIPNHAKIAHPLQRLMRDNVKFVIDEKCKEAFAELKRKLITPPVLAIFDRSKETELHTDASAVGYGAVLLQRQGDGKMHPVYYYSKATSPEESRCHSYELETLAIVYALQKFDNYLRPIEFTIITDCSALSPTFDKKNLCPKIARWALALQHYHFRIQHRSGIMMGHADALSRCHNTERVDTRDYQAEIMSRIAAVCALTEEELDENINEDEEYDDEAEMQKKIPCKIVSVANQLELNFMVQATQNRDEKILILRTRLENERVDGFELKDGLVYRRDKKQRLQLFVPQEMEENVIRMIHEKICHMGIDKTHEQIKKNFWFENMKTKVDKFIKNCIRCIMCSPPARINERNLYNIPKKPIPFDTIHVDHYGPLPSIKGPRKHILVIIDAFTKFTKLYAVKSTGTNEVKVCLDKYYAAYSRPRRMITDRGSTFRSLDFAEYLLKRNIQHIKIAVKSAQANGQVERVNRIITAMLSKVTDPVDHSDWSKMLEQAEYALNNTTHCATKQTASQLLFGVDQRGEVVDYLTEFLQEILVDEPIQSLKQKREEASTAIHKSQEYNARYFESKNRPPKVYSEGEFVVLRHFDTTVGTNKKFNEKYRGPYVIHKVLPHDRYVIRDIENCQITQLPYDGVVEACKIRKWKEQ